MNWINTIITGFTGIYFVALYIFLTYIGLNLLFGIDHFFKIKRIRSLEIGLENRIYYYVLIPCYNEELVIRQTIEKLLSQNFNGCIVLIDDASEDETLNQIKQVNTSKMRIIRRSKPRAQIGKGDSLNQGMTYVLNDVKKFQREQDQVVVGVLDADGQLSTNTFSKLNSFFSKSYHDVCQLRVKMMNNYRNSLQVSQDLEFFTVNNLSQLVRMHSRTVGLSGNAQFFRLQSISDALGDQPWGNALLDDYEMTIKLMLKGITIDYLDTCWVYQQAIDDTLRLIKQRSRWTQGNLDLLKYIPKIIINRKITITQKTGIAYFLFQPWLNLLVDLSVIILVSFFVYTLTMMFIAYPKLGIDIILIIIGLFVISINVGIIFTQIYIHDLRRQHEKKPTILQLITLPIYVSYMYLILFFSIINAFYRWVRGDNEWVKTSRISEESKRDS